MRVTRCEIPDILFFEPEIYCDERGFFFESYNRRTLSELGFQAEFVQENHLRSVCNALRGLHYQIEHPQGKLVRVIHGEVFDVAVDIRKSSPTFGRWIGFTLSAACKRMVWIPPGFAHGFLTLSESAEVLYKMTDYWYPEHERILAWNDSDIAIAWPLQGEPILSAKDRAGTRLHSASVM